MSILGGILSIGGALLGGILQNESADAQRDAVRQSNEQQINLFRDIYQSETARNQPLIDFRDQRLSYLNALRGFGGESPQPQTRPNAFAPRGGYQTGGGFGQIGPFSGINAQIGQDGAYMPTNAFATPYATAGQPQQGMSQSDAMQMFYDSPEYRMAFQGFEDQGDNYLASQAALGNFYSGATMKRLSELERRNAFNAFGNYYGNIMQETGFGQTGAQNQSAAAQSYGANVGGALGSIGQANANRSAGLYSAYGSGLGNALGAAQYAGFFGG